MNLPGARPATENARIRHAPRAESEGPLTGFSSRLSWTHYRTLLAVEDVRARAFYEIEAEREARLAPRPRTALHVGGPRAVVAELFHLIR